MKEDVFINFMEKPQMKFSALFVVTLLALTLVACGKPTAPESASSENYGTTHEGKPAEGRNELPAK